MFAKPKERFWLAAILVACFNQIPLAQGEIVTRYTETLRGDGEAVFSPETQPDNFRHYSWAQTRRSRTTVAPIYVSDNPEFVFPYQVADQSFSIESQTRLTTVSTQSAGGRQYLEWESDNWSTDFATDSLGLSGALEFSEWSDGQLKIQNRNDREGVDFHHITTTQAYATDHEVLFSAEVTTSAARTYRNFRVGVTNGASGTQENSHYWLFEGRRIYAESIDDGAPGDKFIITSNRNSTTYVVEARLVNGESQLSLYQKGSDPSTAYTHSLGSIDIDKARFFVGAVERDFFVEPDYVLLDNVSAQGKRYQTTAEVLYRQQGETEFQSAAAQWQDGRYQAALDLTSGQYEVQLLTRDASGRVVSRVEETLSQGETYERNATLIQYLSYAFLSQGSRLTEFFDTPLASRLVRIVARVSDSQTGDLVAETITLPMLDVNYNGYVNLSDGEPLANGEYTVEVIAYGNDGSEEIYEPFIYDIGNTNYRRLQSFQWRPELDDVAEVLFKYRRNTSGPDNYVEVVAQRQGEFYQVQLDDLPNVGYEFLIEYRNEFGAVILSVNDHFDANSSAEREIQASFNASYYETTERDGVSLSQFDFAAYLTRVDGLADFAKIAKISASAVEVNTGHSLGMAETYPAGFDNYQGQINIAHRAINAGRYQLTLMVDYHDGSQERIDDIVLEVGRIRQTLRWSVVSGVDAETVGFEYRPADTDEAYLSAVVSLTDGAFTALLESLIPSQDYEYRIFLDLGTNGASGYYHHITGVGNFRAAHRNGIYGTIQWTKREAVDSDGDGVYDPADPYPNDYDNDGTDDDDDAFPQDPNESANHDGDEEGDNADDDDDNDGLPDLVEAEYGLDPFDSADAALDLDGDGRSNLEEYDNGFDLDGDDVKPELTVPADKEVIASGDTTPVDLGQATAVDVKDGNIVPQADNYGPFRPGRHVITWSAADSAGNTSTATQILDVIPLVSLSIEQSAVAEGSEVAVIITLNGSPVNYPVRVPYRVYGTATYPDDHSLSGGEWVLESEAELTEDGRFPLTAQAITTIADGVYEGDETLIVTLTSSENAALGSVDEQTIFLTEENVAPTVSIAFQQGGQSLAAAYADAGEVSLSAVVSDANPDDRHTYDWNLSVPELPLSAGSEEDGATLTFDPSGLAGLYRIGVTVTDRHGATATATSSIRIDSQIPLLSEDEDSDGDTGSDAEEGITDSNGNRIADYLDPIVSAHLLPVNTEGSYIQAWSGQQLALGDIVYALADNKAALSLDAMAFYLDSDLPLASESYFPAGAFNFEVRGLVGDDPATVVIPLAVPLPSNARYLNYDTEAGWKPFRTGDDVLASTAGAPGICPEPGSGHYQAGLAEGHYCVQLSIRDGGFNDADGSTDNVVRQLGAVAGDYPPEPVVEVRTGSLKSTSFRSGDGEQVVYSVTFTSDSSDVVISELNLWSSENLDELLGQGEMKLYLDEDANGIAEAGEHIGSGHYRSDSGTLSLILSNPLQLTAGDSVFLVTYRF